MTSRIIDVLKNPPLLTCSACRVCLERKEELCNGDCIDYPEWRKQVLAAVRVDEGKFKETYDEYWVKSEDSSIKTLPDLPTFLIANRERWMK